MSVLDFIGPTHLFLRSMLLQQLLSHLVESQNIFSRTEWVSKLKNVPDLR